MDTKTLGICIIGCGMMGNIHAGRWNNLEEAKIAAVVDTLPERAEALARKYGLSEWHTDYRQALRLPGVDVVSVCVPTYLHAQVTLEAIRQGKHVLCEKPIALTLEDARAMAAAAEKQGVRLGIGFMRRHSPVLVKLKDWLAAGGLGRPLLYYASDIREIRPKLAMHDACQNGGPAIDRAVHRYDTWACAFGSQPVEVLGRGFTRGKDRPELISIPQLAPDTATLTARYASGDLGTFVVSWGLPPAVNPPAMPDQIYGPRGLAEVVFGIQHQHLRWMKEGGEWVTIAECDEDMYQREIAAMARWILEGGDFPATGQDGEAALAAALQGLRAIHTR